MAGSDISDDLMGDPNCVSLDLLIGDQDGPGATNEEPHEAICLRIISNTRFRFGGLQITVKSPAFEIGKVFNVSIDDSNSIVGIDSFRDVGSMDTNSPSPGSSRSPTPSPRPSNARKISLVGSLAPKPARIVINPSTNPVASGDDTPTMSAHVVVEERNAAILASGVRREEIERIFENLTVSGLRQPETSTSRVSIGVGTGPCNANEKDSLRLDASGHLRRAKSWKK